MIFYHATNFDNLVSIADKGLQLSYDGVVYLCKDPKDCLKFALVHGVHTVLMCKVDIPKSWVVETFDHSEAFFKCRCFGSTKEIPVSKIVEYSKYEI